MVRPPSDLVWIRQWLYLPSRLEGGGEGGGEGGREGEGEGEGEREGGREGGWRRKERKRTKFTMQFTKIQVCLYMQLRVDTSIYV